MNQMKFRKIASIFLAAAMTCGMMALSILKPVRLLAAVLPSKPDGVLLRAL